MSSVDGERSIYRLQAKRRLVKRQALRNGGGRLDKATTRKKETKNRQRGRKGVRERLGEGKPPFRPSGKREVRQDIGKDVRILMY